MDTDFDYEVLFVTCPQCKAQQGQPCDVKGNSSRTYHLGRADKAIRLMNKRQVVKSDARYVDANPYGTRTPATDAFKYLSERTTRDPVGREESVDVMADYKAWEKATYDWPPRGRPVESIGKALAANGVQTYRSNGKRYYLGFRLQPPQPAEPTEPVSLFDLPNGPPT